MKTCVLLAVAVMCAGRIQAAPMAQGPCGSGTLDEYLSVTPLNYCTAGAFSIFGFVFQPISAPLSVQPSQVGVHVSGTNNGIAVIFTGPIVVPAQAVRSLDIGVIFGNVPAGGYLEKTFLVEGDSITYRSDDLTSFYTPVSSSNNSPTFKIGACQGHCDIMDIFPVYYVKPTTKKLGGAFLLQPVPGAQVVIKTFEVGIDKAFNSGIPEPSTYVMLGTGLAVVIGLRRRSLRHKPT